MLAQRAIHLDGSHSSLAPATPQRVALDLAVYAAAMVAVLATYSALLFLAYRGRIRALGVAVVLVAPVALQVALFTQRPWLSTDVLSYIAQGAVGLGGGVGNAYTNVPRDVLGTPVGAQLTALGWRPQVILSPYGPLWTAYEVGVMRLTGDVGQAMLLLKLPALLASLGSAALIWRILAMVRPGRQLLGTVAFLWSPVVITELAAEGHVDGLMVFLVLLGVSFTLRGRPVSSAVAGVLAVLTKYLPLILLPAQLVYLWRRAAVPESPRSRLVLAAVVGLALAGLLFAPFWVGFRTLDGLRVMGQPGPWPTVTGLIYRYLERTWPAVDAGVIATIVVTGEFVIVLLRAAARVDDARSLLAALAQTTLVFVLVASPVFYPWYAILPIAMIALVPRASYLVIVVAMTAASRIVAPFVDLRPAYDPIPAAAYTLTTAGLFVCIGLAIALALREVWAWATSDEPPTPGESPAAAA